jgi:protein pelota
MKLIKNNISAKDGSGDVVLRPEDPEDMWHVYNLIAKNDEVKADTYRKVVSTSSTGSTRSEKRKITLTLRVQETDFDPQESTLRVKGVNVVENKFVKIGASHTIELEPNRNFTLCKPCWDTIFM